MRIGVVIYGSLATTTGGFLYDRRLVDYLRQQEVTVEIIALPWRSYPRHLLDNLRPSVRRRLNSASIDILVQDELCHPSLVWHNRQLDYPVVSLVHHLRASESHSGLSDRLYRGLERQYLHRVDAVICSSRATCAAVDRIAPVSESVVAHPGTGRFDPHIDRAAIADRAHESGPLRIRFLGTLIPRKGAHTLLQGVARLPGDQWELTIIGDRSTAPDYVDRLDRQVDQYGIRDRVTFAGQIPDPALEDHLSTGHLLAIPSTYEGFGIAYLEGMGFGLPPLATTAGGASELITDGEDGLLVPPADPEAITRRIAPLLEDRDRLASLGKAARARYERHPSWSESMATIYSFLRRIRNA